MSKPMGGVCPPRFSALREAFEAGLAEEQGARFTLVIDGEVAADLWGGYADRAGTAPVDERTLFPVFSTTKAVAALMIARLVEAGLLDYAAPVARYWPEFAAAGKAAITVEQLVSHQAGLCGFADPIDPAQWLDWDATCAALCAMAPLWPPGTASGYHPSTFGYLVGELYRRASGRDMAADLDAQIAGPAGLDLHIGLPQGQEARLADLLRPKAMPDFGGFNAYNRAAFLEKWSTPGAVGGDAFKRLPLPSTNGFATSEALARLMGALAAGDGRIGEVHILDPEMRERAAAQRIAGRDLVLPFEVSWGAGFMRNAPNYFYGPSGSAFGHSGWGGSCAFADPENGVAGAYVMNRQSPHLMGDPRARRLIAAAYEGIG